MKIYLWFVNEGWKLVDSEEDNKFNDYLKKRNIVISDSAKIGNYAEIGNSAKIGDYAEIGNSAKIGNYAEIKINFNKDNKQVFSEEYIFYMVGVLMQKGKGIFYKAVQKDLTDFQTGKYQYKIGKDDDCKLKRNQEIECGEGWHWTSYERAVAFAEKRPHKIISAEIELKDILSVYNKVRVKKFANVKLIEFDK